MPVVTISAAATETSPLLGPHPSSNHTAASGIQIAAGAAGDGFSEDATVGVILPIDDDEETAGGAEEEEEEEEEDGVSKEVMLVMSAVWIGAFLAALDTTIVASTLPTIGSSFNASNSIAWVGTSYMLTQAAFQPIYAQTADVFGRKAMSLVASGSFLFGSLFCGVSRTFYQLVGARALAGLGAGGLSLMSSIVISDMVPMRRRAMYQSYGNTVFAAGASLGGPLGGFLADKVGWRFVFLIQVPICILHFVFVGLRLPAWKSEGNTYEKLKLIDFPGSVLLALGVTSLLLGLSLGGNEQPWSSPTVYTTILVGFAILAVFFYYEGSVAKKPLIKPRVLFAKSPGLLTVVYFISFMTQITVVYQAPLYFTVVEQDSASVAGLYLIPTVVVSSISSIVAGIWMARTGKYKKLLFAACLFNLAGSCLISSWDRRYTPSIVYWLTMLFPGIGVGIVLVSALTGSMASVGPEDMGIMIAVIYLFRSLGTVLGVSLSTAVFQNILKIRLERFIKGPDAASIIETIRLDIDSISQLPFETKEIAIAASQFAIRIVFIVAAGLGTMATLAVLPIDEYVLSKKLDAKK